MKRVLFGVINIFPSVFIIFGIIISLYIGVKVDPDDIIPVEYRIYVVLGLLLLFVSIVTELVLMIVYIVHSVPKNKCLAKSSKTAWLLCLWFFNIFAIPVYWYKYILKK